MVHVGPIGSVKEFPAL